MKRQNKETKTQKQFRVIKGYNIWTGEIEEINLITDEVGLGNIVMNGLVDLEVEEI